MTRPAFDRVKVLWTGTGSGTITLGSAISGFQAFPSALNGHVVAYQIQHQASSQAEAGYGTYNSGSNSLTRDFRTYPTLGGAAVSFTTGDKHVSLTALATEIVPDFRTTDPTPTDDINAGYLAGRSKVLNTTTNTLWMCTRHVAGGAVWTSVGGTGSGGGEVNLGANVATDGVGVFDGKVGVTLNYRGIASTTTAGLTVTLDDVQNDIDLALIYATLADAQGTVDSGKVMTAQRTFQSIDQHALRPVDLVTSGSITPRANSLIFSGGSSGNVWTVQSDGSVAFQTPSAATVTVNQYEIVGRVAAGQGSAGGLAVGNLTEETAPGATTFMLAWVAGALRVVKATNLVTSQTVPVFLGRTGIDPTPITTITETHVNSQVVISADATLTSFTVGPPGPSGAIPAPFVSISNQSVATINITLSGCTVDGAATAQPIAPGAELVLVALATGQFYIQGGGAGTSALWGNIGGDITEQADLVTSLNTKAPLSNPTFSDLVTFTAGTRRASGTVSGALSMAAHGGGSWLTGGNCTVPNQAGFEVTLIAGGANHSIDAGAGSTPVSLVNAGDWLEVRSPVVGTVRARKTTTAGAVSLHSLVGTVTTFEARVTALGASVVSYWRLDGDYTDAKGVQHGSAVGSPALSIPTIVHFDDIAEGAPSNRTCIATSGANYVTIPHNTAHKTANGTMVVFFQRNTTAGGKATLLEGDATLATGGFSLEVTANGEPRFYLRAADGPGGLWDLLGTAGQIQLGRAYGICVEWGPTLGGLRMEVFNDGGSSLGAKAFTTNSGIVGTSPFNIGRWRGTTSTHAGPIGRIIWMNAPFASGAARNSIMTMAKTITYL